MSNANCESTANLTAVSSDNPSAKATSETSGLETIVLALQALQKEPRRKVDEGEPASKLPISKLPTANLPTATPTNFPPIPHGMNSARRVVSTDSIGDSDIDSTKLQQHPPQVKEEETVSTSDKASDATHSAAVETTTSSSVQSSPAPSPPPSEIATDEVLMSSDDPKAADFSQILADPEGWLKQTENLFAKLPPVDRSTDKEIIVQPNDVLCGRGGETNHHPGNIRYRSLVKAYQKLYLLAKRRDKPKIAQCIVVSVRGVEGRFLKRTKNASNGSAWVDVGNVKAREKTSQALREGAPNLRENVTPPGTTSASNDGTASSTNARQVLAPDQAESMAAPPTAAPQTLSTSAPTALESMMGWKWPEPSKASSAPVPPVASSSVPHVSSSPAAPPSDADNDAYLKIFTKAAAQLMQHPAFHQLDQARQYEAILFECKNARAAVESAKRNSTGTTTAANVHDQGRTSPMIATSMNQQQGPQSQKHRQPYPTHEYPYYPHSQQRYYPQVQGSMWPANNPKNPSNMDVKPEQALSLLASKFAASQTDKSVNLQTMYRELLVAKAAASTGLSSGLASNKIPVGESSSTEEQRLKAKKRPASCSSSSVQTMSPAAAVVSDTGSDTSSSSSSCESLSASGSAVIKDEKSEAVTSASRGGSRLKRLKLRMKDDFN